MIVWITGSGAGDSRSQRGFFYGRVIEPTLLHPIDTGANQGHGIVVLRRGATHASPELSIGDRGQILPTHACVTAARQTSYHVVRAAARQVFAQWPRFGGW